MPKCVIWGLFLTALLVRQQEYRRFATVADQSIKSESDTRMNEAMSLAERAECSRAQR